MFTFNEHSVVFKTMTNGDLCDFLKSLRGFSSVVSTEKGRQYKCLVMQYFTCTLQYTVLQSKKFQFGSRGKCGTVPIC